MSSKTKDYILTESGNHISRIGLNLVNTQSIILGGKTIIESHVTMRGDLRRKSVPRRQNPDTAAAAAEKSPGSDGAIMVGRYCLLGTGSSFIPPHRNILFPSLVDPDEPNSSSPSLPPLTFDPSLHLTDSFSHGPGSGNRHHAADTTTGPIKGSRLYSPLKIGDYVSIGPNSMISAASIASYVHIGARCLVGSMSIIKEGSIIEDDTEIPPYSVIPPFSRVRGKPGLVFADTPEVFIDVIRERLRDNYARVIAKT